MRPGISTAEKKARAALSKVPQDFRARDTFKLDETLPRDDRFSALLAELDRTQDRETKARILVAYLEESLDQDGFENDEPGEIVEDQQYIDVFKLGLKHGLTGIVDRWFIQLSLSKSVGPLERPNCANRQIVSLENDEPSCKNEGKLVCSKCKLVLYCSKECQKKHWRKWHKQTCDQWSDWEPAWVAQNRRPNFGTEGASSKTSKQKNRLSPTIRLWGKMPAVDTLNLARNEANSSTSLNLALAYLASSGLRNVVRTINELPSDFSGEVNILLNDREPIIAIRNLMILFLLVCIQDVKRAADVALHFWASACIDYEWETICSRMMRTIILSLKEDRSFLLRISENSRVSGIVSEATIKLLNQIQGFRVPYLHAQDELQRVMFDESRQDRVDRMYCRMKTPHRAALQQFRLIGNVLPHGNDSSLVEPNKFLYSLNGRWLQDDMAAPLDEWNIEDVIAGGVAHGAQAADIYGCLNFYLADQLRTFAQRLRDFKISINIFTEEPRALARNLSDGLYESIGLPRSFFFDRIDISDIAESYTIALTDLLEDWAPFLNKNNPSSAILGYFANWTSKQRKSLPGPAEMQALTVDLIQKGRLDKEKMLPELIPVWLKYFVALHDNSTAFEEFMKKQGVDDAALQLGLRRKIEHTIVPHRIGARLGDPPNALPHFPTDNSWYWNVQVSQASLSERYVEFGIAQ